MTEPKKENGANLPLVGLGLILAAGAGVAVGWFAHKPPATPKEKAVATAPADGQKPASPSERAAAGDQGKTGSGAAATAPGTAASDLPGSPEVAATGPCADYATKICEAAGETSEECKSAKKMGEMMPASACQAALAEVDMALARITASKQICTDLQVKLCNDIGNDTEACNLVKQQTPNFPADRCKMMMEQYDNVLKDLQRMEARNKPLAPELIAKLVGGEVSSFGPADAKVVVVEFSDFLCPYCRYAAETVEKIRDRYSPMVRFIFRQFPLPMHGPNARLAAQAALAARAQGKFWEMHDALFANTDKVQGSGRAAIDELAAAIPGLDLVAFKAALDGSTFDAAVTAEAAIGEEAFVDGTPSLFLNGQRMNVDPRDPVAFAEALDVALTAAGVTPPPPEAPASPAAPASSAPVTE